MQQQEQQQQQQHSLSHWWTGKQEEKGLALDVIDYAKDPRLMPFPIARPSMFPLEDDVEPAYQASIHLNPELLTMHVPVTLLDFTMVDFAPIVPPQDKSALSFTKPFQLLSHEGVKTLRQVIDRLKKYAVTTERQPLAMRFLAYRSRWIRDFNNCPIVLSFLSRLAGQPLMPHSFPSNFSHTNIGVIGDSRAVDQWHLDSVPFVVVILMSDMTDAKGGELQVIKHRKQAAFDLLEQTHNQVPDEHLLTVQYPGLGSAIFMQGSEMVHHVTSVLSAPEPRITVVNSYMPIHPFAEEQTRFHTFRLEPTIHYEYARHKAWRISQQLQSLVNRENWPTDVHQDLLPTFEKCFNELRITMAILKGEQKDELAFFRENKPHQIGDPAASSNATSSEKK